MRHRSVLVSLAVAAVAIALSGCGTSDAPSLADRVQQARESWLAGCVEQADPQLGGPERLAAFCGCVTRKAFQQLTDEEIARLAEPSGAGRESAARAARLSVDATRPCLEEITG